MSDAPKTATRRTKRQTVAAINPIIAEMDGGMALIADCNRDMLVASANAITTHARYDELMAGASGYNDDNFWPADDDWRAQFRPYDVVDGILQIPVSGILLHKFPWAFGGWATGYAYIERAFARGMQDDEVKGIAFVCNSHGGFVSECFDVVDKMFAAKEANGKPVRAYVADFAYSAAYAVTSLADHITVTRTGGVGSIGVRTAHVDYSKMQDQIGVKVTHIFAGDYKVDGNPDEPLSERAREQMQGRINEIYDIFVSTVARNRSMSEAAVRNTKAATFSAPQAVSNGLADAVGSLDDAVAAFAADLSPSNGENEMSNKGNQAESNTAENTETVAPETATADAIANAVAADRERSSAIRNSEEAKGREELANHLADTGMDVDGAKAILAKAPVATAEAPPAENAETPFNVAMSQGNPEVGATQENAEAAQDGSDVIAIVHQFGIPGFKAKSA